MKKLFSAAVIVFFIACSDVKPNKETTLIISGMTCDGCVKNITKKLEELDGVATVKVSLKDSTAVISYDSVKTNEKSFIEAIEKNKKYKVKRVVK